MNYLRRSWNQNFRRFLSTQMMSNRFVWIDLELTGLDENKDHILEIACIVTEGNLDIVAEGPNLVIHQPEFILNSMNEWSKEHHQQTGLTEACRKSQISLEQAESEVHQFISKHTQLGKCFLAGNTVYMDRRFLEKYMPKVNNHLHYRIIDVSTVKELVKSWFPDKTSSIPRKKLVHRSLDDIKESIEELRFYKANFFI